jgi:hypothetical protein
MSDSWITEEMLEAGAEALYGDGWATKATIANKRYYREKAKAVFLAMYRQYILQKTPEKHF